MIFLWTYIFLFTTQIEKKYLVIGLLLQREEQYRLEKYIEKIN
jgi:hypothetical protein